MARILVVDDEVRLAQALKRGLEADGFAVDLAHDGQEAIWLAGQGVYDVIVLDIMLPLRDGFDVCAAVRDAGVLAPVLMLTARDSPRDEIRALDTGADDYLAKPFSFRVLTARIRALLRRGAPSRLPVLAAGDLHLDPGTHRCTIAGRPVELTSREFAVLEYLLRRGGEVASKANILDHVWDFAFDGDPNIIEVYISRLRKKVDEPFGRRSIETVRGEGYRIDPAGSGTLVTP